LVGASHVVGVPARTRADLDRVRTEIGDTFTPVSADAADPATASRLIDEYRPQTLVLCAVAAPPMRALQEQTWQSFSLNCHVDVAQAFHWVRESLRRGSSVIAISSGAAINGSPLSGGYAGANATVRFIASYAAIESEREGLAIRFVSVLPQLTPATDLGSAAVSAYAKRENIDVETFLKRRGPVLTPEHVGKPVLDLCTTEQPDHHAYMLSAAGLAPLG
jgi:NAD(P)-dependent dehydrogenase (short-subunit alcohol dehydrogenase family)